jgi:hypothetical protein
MESWYRHGFFNFSLLSQRTSALLHNMRSLKSYDRGFKVLELLDNVTVSISLFPKSTSIREDRYWSYNQEFGALFMLETGRGYIYSLGLEKGGRS